jgi:hypothetical protein
MSASHRGCVKTHLREDALEDFFLAHSEQRRISLPEGSKSGFLVARAGTASRYEQVSGRLF